MKASSEIVHGLEERKKIQNIIKLFLLISIGAALFYFSYLFNPSNIDNAYLYIFLVFAELYIFIQCVGTWYTLLLSPTDDPSKHSGYRKLVNQLKETAEIDGGVAVFVNVCGEPIEIVEATLAAAVAIKVKHKTYLVDDLGKLAGKANKPYQEMAKRVGASYIKTIENYEFKVGALNYALKQVNTKYFVNFDSDFIPQKDFLLETLPYFHDLKLGWVQTPQVFRDSNNLISRGAADAVTAFYSNVMPGKNAFNAALFVGTNALFRREALDSIGGFKSHHSEDVYTGYNLHQAGWKSLAIPEKLAFGLAPENVASLFKQVLRWSGGSLEIFLHERVFKRNLTVDQKFQYFVTFSFYLYGLVILIMLLFPMLYLLFGIKPLGSSYSNEWAVHYLPYFIFQFTTIALFASKLSLPAILTSMNLYPVTIKGFFNAVRRKHSKWVVTNLGKDQKTNFFQGAEILYWHYLIAFMSIISILIGLVNVRESLTTAISIFWVGLNLIFTIIFIFHSHKSLQQ